MLRKRESNKKDLSAELYFYLFLIIVYLLIRKRVAVGPWAAFPEHEFLNDRGYRELNIPAKFKFKTQDFSKPERSHLSVTEMQTRLSDSTNTCQNHKKCPRPRPICDLRASSSLLQPQLHRLRQQDFPANQNPKRLPLHCPH